MAFLDSAKRDVPVAMDVAHRRIAIERFQKRDSIRVNGRLNLSATQDASSYQRSTASFGATRLEVMTRSRQLLQALFFAALIF
jgi:hypothetical protein